MSTNFPTSKQSFTAALATNNLDTPSHSEYHNNLGDTVEAIEEALGIGSVVKFGLRPASDSTTAIRFQDAAGSTSVVTIDTTNSVASITRVGVGISLPIGSLHVVPSSAEYPFIFGGSTLGSFTGATISTTNKIACAGHGLTPTAGDLLVITASDTGNEGIYYVASYTSTVITLDGNFLNGSDTNVNFTIISGAMAIGKEDGSGNQYIVGGFLKYRSLFMEYGTDDSYSRPQLWLKTTDSIIRVGSFQGDGDGIGNNQAGNGIIIYGGNAQGDTFDADNYGYCRLKPERIEIYNKKNGVYTGDLFRIDVQDGDFYAKDDSGNTTLDFDRAAGELVISSKIGIKTTQALSADLTIEGAGGENFYIYRYGDNANPPGIKFWKSRGSIGSQTIASDGDDTGKLEAWVWARNQGDTDDDWVRTGMIIMEVDGLDAQDRIGGRIEFFTSAGVSVTPGEKFSIGTDNIEVYKIATATVATQYESWDFRMRASVWNETGSVAEDRIMYWTLNAGSGASGSEPYYLSLYDNDGTEMLRVDPMNTVAPAILIPDYILHLGDLDTGCRLQNDRITWYAGARTMVDAIETTQDILYLGHDGSNDIDVSIGVSGCLFVEGSSGNVTLSNSLIVSDINIPEDSGANVNIVDMSVSATPAGGTEESYVFSIDGTAIIEVYAEADGAGGIQNPRFYVHEEMHVEGDSYIGLLQFEADSGATTAFDMSVTSSPAGSTEESYAFKIDNTSIMKIYAEADGAGGIQNECVYVYKPLRLQDIIDLNSKTYITSLRETLDDDETTSLGLTITHSCRGWIISSNSGVVDAWAEFVLGGDGNATLIVDSGNVVANADTDANLCVGTAAAQEPLTIKNRLGGTREILIGVQYY